jgi:hypothetical protein
MSQNSPTEIFLWKKLKQARQGQGRRLAPLFKTHFFGIQREKKEA